jgi:hypothetical protein
MRTSFCAVLKWVFPVSCVPPEADLPVMLFLIIGVAAAGAIYFKTAISRLSAMKILILQSWCVTFI